MIDIFKRLVFHKHAHGEKLLKNLSLRKFVNFSTECIERKNSQAR